MRAFTGLLLLALLAGCSQPPAAIGPVEETSSEDPARTSREGVLLSQSICQDSVLLGVGTGEGLVLVVEQGGLSCQVILWTDEGEMYQSGRLAMDWESGPGLLDAYVAFEVDGEPIASASSATSPIVLEFDIPPTFDYGAVVRYGGTGLASTMDVTITVDLSDPQVPAPRLQD
jgi:hypothetical protein